MFLTVQGHAFGKSTITRLNPSQPNIKFTRLDKTGLYSWDQVSNSAINHLLARGLQIMRQVQDTQHLPALDALKRLTDSAACIVQHTRKEPTERMDNIFPDALPELIDTIELRFHIPKGARAKAAGSLFTGVAGTPTGTFVAGTPTGVLPTGVLHEDEEEVRGRTRLQTHTSS